MIDRCHAPLKTPHQNIKRKTTSVNKLTKYHKRLLFSVSASVSASPHWLWTPHQHRSQNMTHVVEEDSAHGITTSSNTSFLYCQIQRGLWRIDFTIQDIFRIVVVGDRVPTEAITHTSTASLIILQQRFWISRWDLHDECLWKRVKIISSQEMWHLRKSVEANKGHWSGPEADAEQQNPSSVFLTAAAKKEKGDIVRNAGTLNPLCPC